MSYILDALKRADAERERGHVPGLRTQPLTVDSSVEKRRTPKPWLLWLGLGLAGLALLAVVSGWWRADTGEVSTAATPAPEVAREEAPTIARKSPPEPEPVAVQEAPALPILSPELPRVKPPRAPAPATGTEIPDKAQARSVSGSQTSTATATAAAATVAAAPSSPSTSIRNFSELSPEERARLPAVNVSGATYSKNPALRMLIVNGKVSLEGEEVVPGLKLETIEPRTAVLNHQGMRYRIGY
jgi:general secretion pathway protein B